MDKIEFENMVKKQENHWWYVSRRKIISKSIKNLNLPKNPKILEVGCGMGGNLQMLAKFGKVYGCEYNKEALAYCQNIEGNFILEYAELPNKTAFPERKFDLIVMFDVLEHIKDDAQTINTLKKQLKPDGVILLTVPALPILWSPHDETCHHQRRYIKQNLNSLFAKAKMQKLYCSYYNFFLFPPIFMVRMLQKLFPTKKTTNIGALAPSKTINWLLTKIFSAEKPFLPKLGFPFGVSIIAAYKQQNT